MKNGILNIIQILMTVLLSFTATHGFAQEPVSIKVVPTINYLPSTIYYVTKDANEFIWIGTNTGVYRYDGYTFTHFTSADGLGDNEILRIYEDKKGRIWFQSVNGNPSFYLDGKVYNTANSALLAQLKFKKMILTECEDSLGNLYIGSREFLYYKIDAADKVTQLSFSGQENYMWIGSNNQPKFIERKFKTGFQPIRGDALGNNNYLGVKLDLYKIEQDTNLNLQYTLPESAQEIIYVRIKNDHELYVGTRNGLYIYYPGTNKAPRIIMQGLSISSVEFDFEDNLWVSTLEAGLYIIPSLDVNIYNKGNGLPEDKITCIEHDAKGNLWVGMAKDNYTIISPENKFTNYRLTIGSSHDITNIRHFGNDTYVVGKSSIIKINETGTKNYQIYGNDIYIGELGNIYLAQDNTILIKQELFEHHIREVVYNMVFKRQEFEFVNARTNVLKADKYGNLWLGTSKGIYYNSDSLVNMGANNPLLKSPVRDVAFDNNGFFTYVATLNGLFIIRDNKLIKTLDKAAGLPNSECNALYVDTQNYLWAAFGNELIRIRYTDNTIEVINYTHKLKIEGGRITDIDIIGDMVYMATEAGLIYFNKATTKAFATAPQLQFVDFMVNSSSYMQSSERTFNHSENDISISYSGMSFLSKAEVHYTYFLEGYDTAWHLTNERTLHYKSLPPGSYNFKIAAINKSGHQSILKTIPFIIEPPFWTLWWFWLLILSLFTTTLYLLWRNRLQALKYQYDQKNKTFKLEKENAQFEMKLSELSQQAFRQQMNPHFIFNALNTIKGYYAEGDVKKASDYISKFSKLLRNILENKEQFIPLEKEIHAINLYLELAGMRYENKFVYSVLTDESIKGDEIGIPPMLLQPFIENSLIHGIAPKQGKGTILIEFKIAENRLQCIITDDGIGRSASSAKSRIENHNSKATLLITEYLEALNNKENTNKFTINIRDLLNKQGEAIGTQVILLMPLIYLDNTTL